MFKIFAAIVGVSSAIQVQPTRSGRAYQIGEVDRLAKRARTWAEAPQHTVGSSQSSETFRMINEMCSVTPTTKKDANKWSAITAYVKHHDLVDSQQFVVDQIGKLVGAALRHGDVDFVAHIAHLQQAYGLLA